MTPPTVTMLSRARSAPLSAEHNGLFDKFFLIFNNFGLNKGPLPNYVDKLCLFLTTYPPPFTFSTL